MKLVVSWLGSLVEFNSAPQELPRILSERGLLVDSSEKITWSGKSIVVGKVLSVEKHPSAGNLIVCSVDVGSSGLRIVCGATNVKPGMTVPVAVPGSFLPGGRKIESITLRGIRSEGMLCSPLELEISSDGEGILELPSELEKGTPLGEALGLDDTVLEVDIPHDRADCLCVLGIAREVVASGFAKWKKKDERKASLPKLDFPIRVEDTEGCPRYAAAIVENIKVTPSPFWMQRRLELSGMRPINSVVDVTNYCLLERGQPIHAFDLEKLSGGIIVRRAKKGEKIKTLDGVERNLFEDVLVIADSEKPVAIAGIMGGEESEVTASTKKILLESAFFERRRVGKGSKLLALSSEASMRFSRGVDQEGVVPALLLVRGLLGELGAGTPLDAISIVGDKPHESKTVFLDMGRLDSMLGTSPEVRETLSILDSLGFSPAIDGKRIKTSVPSFRYDINEEADLIEEVARSYGYGKLPSTLGNLSGLPGRKNSTDEFNNRLREFMVGLGFAEILTNCLIDEESPTLFGFEKDDLVKVLNPLSSSSAYLRPTLMCGVTQTIVRNLRRGGQSIRVFELGKLFTKKRGAPPEEKFVLTFGITGERVPDRWDPTGGKVDIFDAKGIVGVLLSELRVDTPHTFCYDKKGFRKGSSCGFSAAGAELGFLGEVEPQVVDSVPGVYVGELDVDQLMGLSRGIREYFEPPRFPGIKRDISIIVETGIAEAELRETIRLSGGNYLKELKLFDVYEGKEIPKGKKSLAYSLFFRSNERTLSDEDANSEVERIVKELRDRKGAVLRAAHS
ncbi:MAG: phenylalanine--tRNA ligase subunit beta [Candidatus Eisenbacteria bacterium]|nr:phenylalanine--tRNA ligase subunit beta [Candidatus Eisenbacteria bacterium]